MGRREGAGWIAEYDPETRQAHVLPINDVMEHSDFWDTCNCKPKVEQFRNAEGDLSYNIVHNSLDGREVPQDRQPTYVLTELPIALAAVALVAGVSAAVTRWLVRRAG